MEKPMRGTGYSLKRVIYPGLEIWERPVTPREANLKAYWWHYRLEQEKADHKCNGCYKQIVRLPLTCVHNG